MQTYKEAFLAYCKLSIWIIKLVVIVGVICAVLYGALLAQNKYQIIKPSDPVYVRVEDKAEATSMYERQVKYLEEENVHHNPAGKALDSVLEIYGMPESYFANHTEEDVVTASVVEEKLEFEEAVIPAEPVQSTSDRYLRKD